MGQSLSRIVSWSHINAETYGGDMQCIELVAAHGGVCFALPVGKANATSPEHYRQTCEDDPRLH